MKPYEILIRFHSDGRVGAHVLQYKADGVTPDETPIALQTADFPALSKETIGKLLDENQAALVAGCVKLTGDCVAMAEKVAAAEEARDNALTEKQVAQKQTRALASATLIAREVQSQVKSKA